MSNLIKDLFFKSENFSIKLEKYFDVYEKYFSNYKGQKIIFVEIGVYNGGSLKIWKKFFGDNAKIIGIDINPECKKFEEPGIDIYIGNQSDPNFWYNFFQKVGNVDIILDDGGHTNLDQIITTTQCIPYINDGGILMVEDVSTSYINSYNSKKSFSFINFAKKIIDDVNYTYDNSKKFNFSLNKYIYSTHFYESMVIFKVNRSKTIQNNKIDNSGIYHKIENLTWVGNKLNITTIAKTLDKINFINFKKIKKIIKNIVNSKILSKFFN